MDTLTRIETLSSRLLLVLWTVLVLLPVSSLLLWMGAGEWPGLLDFSYPGIPFQKPLPVLSRSAGFIVDLIPLAIQMYGTWQLITLFRLYRRGLIFAQGNVECVRRLGNCLLLWFVLMPLHEALLSVALTLHHGEGEHLLMISFTDSNLLALIVGFILRLVAWVMEEGRKLDEESQLTI